MLFAWIKLYTKIEWDTELRFRMYTNISDDTGMLFEMEKYCRKVLKRRKIIKSNGVATGQAVTSVSHTYEYLGIPQWRENK